MYDYGTDIKEIWFAPIEIDQKFDFLFVFHETEENKKTKFRIVNFHQAISVLQTMWQNSVPYD